MLKGVRVGLAACGLSACLPLDVNWRSVCWHQNSEPSAPRELEHGAGRRVARSSSSNVRSSKPDRSSAAHLSSARNVLTCQSRSHGAPACFLSHPDEPRMSLSITCLPGTGVGKLRRPRESSRVEGARTRRSRCGAAPRLQLLIELVHLSQIQCD